MPHADGLELRWRAGPLLISRVIDVTGSYTLAFYIIAAIMVGSAVVAFVVRPLTRGSEVTAPQAEEARAWGWLGWG